MRWQRFTVAAVLLIGAGCGTERSHVAAGQTALPAASQPDPDPSPLARSQKPDGEAPKYASTGAILTVGSRQFNAPVDGQLAVRIRAYVNDMPILDDEVREATYSQLVQTLNIPEPERTKVQKEIYERELDKIIEREVILADAFERIKKARPQMLEKLKEAASKEFDKQVRAMKTRAAESGRIVKSDEELKAVLRAQGLTMEGVRRQIERSYMAMEYMRSRIFDSIDKIGHPQIQEYYDDHPGEFQIEDRVTWQDIFVDATDTSKFPTREAARQMAEQILARVRKGEDFVQLSKQYDSGMSHFNSNSEGYGQRRGEIKPLEAEPILFELRDGQVGPIIELATGFHVFRLVQRDYAGLRPLDKKTQDEIKKKLTNIIADREFKRIVADLKRNARIERDNEP